MAEGRSCAGLVCGGAHPDAGIADRALTSARSCILDFLGLRRTFRRAGNPGCYSFGSRRRDPAGATANSLLESYLVDRRHCPRHFAGAWIRSTINILFPATALGGYPALTGWLYWFDLAFGLVLVAYSEEVLFRRCARHIFRSYLGDRYVMVLITSVLFGGYHWWTGLGNIAEATFVGVLLMLLLQRSGALWPPVVAHYLSDLAAFA